eukprot:78751-Prorocentrum_lima.AAC.1
MCFGSSAPVQLRSITRYIGQAPNKVASAVGEKTEELEVARKELQIIESYVKLNLDHTRCCTHLALNQKFLLRFNQLHGFCNAWPQ